MYDYVWLCMTMYDYNIVNKFQSDGEILEQVL